MNALVPAPAALTGELLSASDDIRVVAALHPMQQSRIERRMPAGLTLAEIVARIASEPGCRSIPSDFQVLIDSHPVEIKNWHRVRPKPGTTVSMRPVPEGPIFALFGALFGAIGNLFSFIGGGGLFGKLLMTGLTIGVKLLMNALFAPRPPELSKPEPGFSLTGSRNQAAQFEPVPVILGQHRIAPFYGAAPYTEPVGDDQYLRMLFVWGYGPLDVMDIKIGETSLSSFEGVQFETRNGFPGDAPLTLYNQQVIEEALSITLDDGLGFKQRTTAENITEIWVDIVLPNGLIYIDNKGRKKNWTVAVTIEYRAVGSATWLPLHTMNITLATQKTKRFSAGVSVPSGQYEVRAAKTAGAHDPADNVIDDIIWAALRGFRPGAAITFPDPLCVTAIRIKATSQLNGTIDTLNGVVTSLVKAWNGSSWVANTASRNPADLYRHVLQGAANKRPVADARIDLTSLQGWNAYCKANSWTFDKPLAQRASVYDALSDVAAAGRAIPVFKDGRWSVVWDEQNAAVVQMFTPRNSWGFEAQHEYRDRPHAWRVRFINETKDWAQDERIVYDDGYSAANATRFEGIEFPGVTHPDAIWRHGRFHIAQLRLRPETYTINVDFENLVCTRGDRVRVAHDVMLVGLASGRVKSVDAGTQTVVLDETVIVEAGVLYSIRFRLSNGSFVLRSLTPSATEETDTLVLFGSGALPAVGDLFTFGQGESESAVYRVLGIEPQDNLTARITLVDDAPDIYLADNGVIPAFESNVTQPVDPYSLPPSDIRMTQGVYQEGSDFLSVVYLNWSVPRQGQVRFFEVEYRNEGDGTGTFQTGPVAISPQTSAEVRGLQAGVYTFRVRCRFNDNTVSKWLTSEAYAADMLNNRPPDVTGFAISTLGDTSTLSWIAVQATGVTYQIRFVAAGNPATSWNTATPLVPSISGTSVQVPTMVGTYLIKAAYQSGLNSANAALVSTNISTLAGLNIVEVLTENPGYAGVHDDVTSFGGVLRLQENNTMSTWEALADVISMQEGDGDSPGMALSGTYYFDNGVDLGDVYTSRITAVLDARGENPYQVMSLWTSLADVAVLDDTGSDDWEVKLEFRTTMVDPVLADWGDWQPFIVSDVTARAFEFRVILEGRPAEDGIANYSLTTPAVFALKVQVDMPDRVIAGDDIVVPVGGLDITFDPPFKSLHGISTADQNMATGDYGLITAKGPAGFHIQYFNAAGTPVERTVDYLAKGYGLQQAA